MTCTYSVFIVIEMNKILLWIENMIFQWKYIYTLFSKYYANNRIIE